MKYIIGLLIIAGLWACTKEDWPDNSRPEVNPFAVRMPRERRRSCEEAFLTGRVCIYCFRIHWLHKR